METKYLPEFIPRIKLLDKNLMNLERINKYFGTTNG